MTTTETIEFYHKTVEDGRVVSVRRVFTAASPARGVEVGDKLTFDNLNGDPLAGEVVAVYVDYTDCNCDLCDDRCVYFIFADGAGRYYAGHDHLVIDDSRVTANDTSQRSSCLVLDHEHNDPFDAIHPDGFEYAAPGATFGVLREGSRLTLPTSGIGAHISGVVDHVMDARPSCCEQFGPTASFELTERDAGGQQLIHLGHMHRFGDDTGVWFVPVLDPIPRARAVSEGHPPR